MLKLRKAELNLSHALSNVMLFGKTEMPIPCFFLSYTQRQNFAIFLIESFFAEK